jgi:uncharacterized protein (DUF1800 family)
MDNEAAIAFTRFGLGRRKDEPVPDKPRAWLQAQLDQPDPTPTIGLPDCAEGLRVFDVYAQARHALRLSAGAGKDMKETDVAAAERNDPNVSALNERFRAMVHEETVAFIGNALTTQAPFRERLVWFWLNHFTIAGTDGRITACAGPYVREAIRPYVTGKFGDMLLAVMRHPAMLNYLNQAQSIGPDSKVGLKNHKGLNENLARECLELHTVTPAAGYTQTDVTNYAKMLTGWSVELKKEPVGFVFRPQAHEPGSQHVLGYDWPEGEEGAVAFLTWLANHPCTHHHLAEKLVRHFVADDPPPEDVATIAAVLQRTNGDLGAASRAIISLPGAWRPLQKLRTPQEYVVASLRAVGATIDDTPNVVGVITSLGQPFFNPPFPIGWPDRASDWSDSEALLQRVDFAYGLAGRYKDTDPEALAHEQLGSLLDAEVLHQIRGAGSRQDALTMLLASPDFQRR